MTWASDLEVSTFRIGQLLGDQEYVSGEDDEELCLSALQTLTEAERDTVRDALLTGFGGIDGLFLSLWRINHPAPVPKPPKPEKPVKEKPSTSPTETLSLFSTEDEENEEDDEEEDEEDDVFAEDDWAVLNSPSPEKMAAHEWLTDGCYSVR